MLAATSAARDAPPDAEATALPGPGPGWSIVESGFFDAGELLESDAASADVAAESNRRPQRSAPAWLDPLKEDLRRLRRPLAVVASALFVVGVGVSVLSASRASTSPPIAVAPRSEPPPPEAPPAPRKPAPTYAVATKTNVAPTRFVVGPARARPEHGKRATRHHVTKSTKIARRR